MHYGIKRSKEVRLNHFLTEISIQKKKSIKYCIQKVEDTIFGAEIDLGMELLWRELQQEMAREHSVIMDGRDIGTVVLPDAEVKIYLDAGVEERARRRVGELQEKGETADFEEIKKMILERDYNDMHRAHSPLKRAADAVSLDSTGMGIDAVLQAILDIVAERVKEK